MKIKNEMPGKIKLPVNPENFSRANAGVLKKIKMVFLLIFIVLKTTLPVIAAEQEEKMMISNEVAAEDSKKNKKGEDFFQFDIDKLSDKFFTRLAINFMAVFILVRFIYYYNYRKKELFFTYFIFNFIIFLITFFLNKVDMGIGAAFGLFAVFAMLRYRTENISAKDMTYLFLVIAIGLITAVSKVSAIELIILNGLALLLTLGLEGGFFLKKESSKLIQYENIEMIRPEHFPALMSDLKKRTGLNIHRIEFDKVDFLKDTALIKMYYYEDKHLPPMLKEEQ